MLVDLSLPLKAAPEGASERESGLFKLGHYGTHLDRLLGTAIPFYYFKSRGLLFDVSRISTERPVERLDIPLEMIQPGDFVLFHTGAMARHGYGGKAYMAEYIEFSWDLLHAILDRRIRFIGLDARGLRRNEEHRQADIACEEAGAFVIENLMNTGQLSPQVPFTMYTAWFDTGGTGIPCRVTAEF